MLYFLKQKSDTLIATTKYLADINPYGHVKFLRADNGTEFISEPFPLILRIKMGPLNGHGELYFLRQRCVSLLSRNCLKTCGFYALIVSVNVRNRC